MLYPRFVSRLALIGLLGFFFTASVHAAAKAELWPRWNTHNANSGERLSHDTWNAFLKSHVLTTRDGINRVDYAAVSTLDRQKLSAYISQLSDTAITRYNRAEQLAFWINLYNAVTVKVVLDHYPVSSIRKISISPGLFSRGPWGKQLVTVEGVPLTLDDIEHRILRPIWRDPRIHYAVNCASLGCPNLIKEAFTSDNTESLLNQGARDFINHNRAVSVSGNKLITSSIYHWFKDDFGGTDRGVIEHLRRFADPELQAQLAERDRINSHKYDWTLNDRQPRT